MAPLTLPERCRHVPSAARAQPTADGSTDLIPVQAIMRVRQWSQRKNLLKWLKQKIC